ncbi:hypothetical protein WJX81_003349 [Elliptochloris bilobata]|uniref:polynucleotide adenylyltransferase n=1 Tax=Elliptochloris bilobata TaxID=381761 RepID=A0AAW1QMG2_9CHLO
MQTAVQFRYKRLAPLLALGDDALPSLGSAAAAPAVVQGGSDVTSLQTVEEFISLGSPTRPAPKAAVELAAAGEEPSTSGRPALPWTQASRRIQSPLLRLHNEVVEFERFLAPTAEEAAGRAAAVQRISAVVQTIWPSASVQVFGSFATGLYLPTSDLDVVVVGSGCDDVRSALKALANSLVRRSMATNIQIIAKAKVPIIKFTEVESGFNFDVSLDVANGPEAAEIVSKLMIALPPMKPLVLVLKMFLQQRQLNEVYSGGIGSYALLVMVAAFLLLHPSRLDEAAPNAAEANLGILLLDFYRLYGRSLNAAEVGVSCRRGGCFFSKRSRGMMQVDRPHFLAVEDPNEPTNDLGKGSYNIQKVRGAFDFAYQQLAAPTSADESLLERLVRLDDVLTERPRPAEPPESPRATDAERGGESMALGHAHGNGVQRRATSRDKKEKKRKRERDAAFDGDDSDEGQHKRKHYHKHHKHKHKSHIRFD